MNKLEFSESEKNLIFILTLVFMIFLYVTFFRAEKEIDKNYFVEEEFQYEKLNEEYEKLKGENENLKIYENHAKNAFESFGKTQSLPSQLQKDEIEISNYSINKPANVEYEDGEISVLNSQMSISSEFSDLEKILEKILQFSFVDIKTLNVARTDKNRFSFNISLEEISMISIPYNGIEISGENSKEMDVTTLMEHLYKKEENKKPETIENNSPDKDKKTKMLEYNLPEENKKSDTKSKLEAPSEKDAVMKITPITTENYYSELDSKKQELIENSYLKDYKDMEIEMVFDKEFFKGNEEKFKKEKSLAKAVDYDEKTGAVTIDIPNKLKFKEVELRIEKPNDFYVFEYKAKKNSTLEIGFKAADGTYFNVGEISKENDWQEYKFEFPKDEKFYPIKIESISVYGEDENNDAKIRNFAKIKKY